MADFNPFAPPPSIAAPFGFGPPAPVSVPKGFDLGRIRPQPQAASAGTLAAPPLDYGMSVAPPPGPTMSPVPPTPPAPPPPTAPVGAVLGLRHDPGYSTPERMRPDSTTVESSPGAEAALGALPALHDATMGAQLRAEQAAAAAAPEQLGAQQAIADAEAKRAAERQAREEQRRAAIQQEAAKVYTAAQKATELAPSEERARDSLGGGAMTLLGLASIFAGANAGAAGREAPDLIGEAIQRNLENQKAAYNAAQGDVATRRTALGDLRSLGASESEADAAYEAAQRERAAKALEIQLARITDPAKRAAAQAQIVQQRAKAQEALAKLHGDVGAKITAKEAFQAATHSGGGERVLIQTPSGPQWVSSGTAKDLQGLMGVTPGDVRANRELNIKEQEALGSGGVGGGALSKEDRVSARELAQREGEVEAATRDIQGIARTLAAQKKKYGYIPGLNLGAKYDPTFGAGTAIGAALGDEASKQAAANVQLYEKLKASMAAANPGAESDSEWAMFDRQIRGAGDSDSIIRAVDDIEKRSRRALVNARSGYSPAVRAFTEAQRRKVAQEELERSKAAQPAARDGK